MTHLDDDAQIEQLRAWWRENWIALVGGLVIGLGGILGWEAWQDTEAPEAERASQMFEDLKVQLDNAPGRAAEVADALRREFASTPYADHAALLVARDAAVRGEWDAAATRLREVLGGDAPEPLKQLARLRLARVLWQQGGADAALAELDGAPGPYQPLYLELTGDIRLSQGDRDGARAAYQEALAAGPAPGAREFLQHKIDDLAEDPAAK